MKIHKDLIQGSPEWLRARLGKPSASHGSKIVNSYTEPQYYADNKVNEKNGIAGKLKNKAGWGDGAITYALDLLIEVLLDTPTFVPVNFAMEHGLEYEPYAREIYEANKNVVVEQVGGIEDKGVWYSPDGLVGKDGLIEIKCPQPQAHLRFMIGKGDIDSKYIGQMQFGMMVSGRKWCDFISFHPDFPDHLKIKVVRVERDEEYQKLLKSRLEEFIVLQGKLNTKVKLNK